MWGETTATLRFNLEGCGFEALTFIGADLTLHRARGLALIVTAGCGATGELSYVPQVRYERREVITGLVNGSVDTLWEAGERPEWAVWFVLHHLSGSELRGEVSMPNAISPAGLVSSWAERILLPTTTFGGSDGRRRTDDDGPDSIQVDVKRRAG